MNFPKRVDSNHIHSEFLEKIKEYYVDSEQLSDRMILLSLFTNYRADSGLRLSKFGFDLCVKHGILNFTCINFDKKYNNSNIITALDRLCASPYYIIGSNIYLSDDMIVTFLSMASDDFEKMIRQMI